LATPSWRIESAFRHPRVPKYKIVYPYYSNPRPWGATENVLPLLSSPVAAPGTWL